MTVDPIPAISEKAAVLEIAEIYADIKETLDVDVVNLIWRHLASIQGTLPWVWSALKPIYKSGIAEAAAADLMANLRLPNVATLSSPILRAIGVSEADKNIVCGILDTYNRSNTLNLVALSALRAEPSVELIKFPKRKIPEIQVAIPALPDLDAMDSDVLNLVLTISDLGANPKDRIIPSMYRHLSFWPGFLVVAWSLMSPLHSDGRLRILADESYKAGRIYGDFMAKKIHLGAEPSNAQYAINAIEEFRRTAISRMVPIAMILRRSID